jgi:cyclic pyranopterin monophosphate synthase
MNKLTHLDSRGEAAMVDVSAKPILMREAVARGEIRLQRATLELIESSRIAKGNVLATARIAGIQAAKKTGDLIPLCHPLPITHCEIQFEIPKSRDRIVIIASAKIAAQTGVEMEALTAVAIAALTIYDMCKAVDKKMVINQVRLLSKTKRDR